MISPADQFYELVTQNSTDCDIAELQSWGTDDLLKLARLIEVELIERDDEFRKEFPSPFDVECEPDRDY
jgi:hypothetical protein